VDVIGSRALVNTLQISHSAVFLTGVAMIFATSVDRVVQMRKERGREENETEKILSAEIVWTAVPPDNRREQKGRALVKEKGKERNIN
jgi:hypothetical protein